MSKGFLQGKVALTDLYLKPLATYERFEIELKPGTLAMALLMPLVRRLYGPLGPSTLMAAGVLLIAGGTYALSRLTPEVSHS